jgi:hypothetical protein
MLPALGFLCLAALVTTASAPLSARSSQALTRTVYVTVTDKTGAPVTDLKADEFEVKFAGKTAEITGVKLASAPMRISIIAYDRGTGIFQSGVLGFINTFLEKGGKAEFAITGIISQPEKFVDYSSDPEVLKSGILKLGRRGNLTNASGQLIDGIQDAIKDIKREGKRGVILVCRVGGEAPTGVRADRVREDLRQSGAVLYAISTVGTQTVKGTTAGPQTAATAAQAASDAELLEATLTVATILGDGAKDSGGRHEQNISTTMVPTMQKIATELLNQYEITYVIPQAGRPSDRLQVSTKRKNVTLAAPSRVPN